MVRPARHDNAPAIPAASYRANPLQSPGDAILFYKYQGAPLTDYIHYFDHGVDGFKIPASAAYNFDRPEVVCEIYGNFHQKMPNDSSMLYRAGMEVYARGINYLLPHGTWWDPAKMRIVPEISWRNPAIGPELPRYNQWAARCETLLRAGRHTADIGVLYPIDDLAARYHVGLLPFTHGKDPIPGTDYYELSRLLTGEIRRDFTFLHPEIVDARCRVEGREFVLDNPNNWERYRVLILPACRTIRASNLQKARDFLRRGRTSHRDDLPAGAVRGIRARRGGAAHGAGDVRPRRQGRLRARRQTRPRSSRRSTVSVSRGTCASPRRPTSRAPTARRTTMAASCSTTPTPTKAATALFAYLHRSVPGAEVYFFSNASGLTVSADVELRGQLKLETWDPHTGGDSAA